MPIYKGDNIYDKSNVIQNGIRASVWPQEGIAIGPDARLNSLSNQSILIDPAPIDKTSKITASKNAIGIGKIGTITTSDNAILIGTDLSAINETKVVKIGTGSNRLELNVNGLLSLVGPAAGYRLPVHTSLPSAPIGTIIFYTGFDGPAVMTSIGWRQIAVI